MKKTILKKSAILLILAGMIIACKEEENKPIEIPFTEYSLAETSCQWINLDYDNKIIVINSNEELENY
ncbi:MAG: hypothetical protein LBF01_01070, partial [Bacteroidales bacterium]|nr:hypothetical protein [Bacteroidales bacterium]